jgi:diguanylate cyclase (GGDEF)-like protein
MAKRKKLLKMTLGQQVAALQKGLKLLNEYSSLLEFPQLLDELALPFPITGIQLNGIWSPLRGIEASEVSEVVGEANSSATSVVRRDPSFLIAIPFSRGCFLAGHPESVNLDKGLVPFLESLVRVIDLFCDLILTKEESFREIEKLKSETVSEPLWDELTLLPNAKLFPLMMSPMLAHARRSKDLAAIMFLEIGKLDDISVNQGSAMVDKIVKQVLERMMKNLREGDIAVCAGRNRFLWTLGGLHSIEDTTTVAEKMLLSLSRPLEIEGKTVVLNGSIGISLFPSDGPDPDTLMKNAESALEVSRKTPGNSIRFFMREANEKIRSYLVSRKELREAVSKQEFALHYQPLVRLQGNEVEALEALIRWRKAQGTTVYPVEFLELSEQIGISDQLDDWMIRAAVYQRNAFEKENQVSLRISVNLSRHYFLETGVDKIAAIIKETGVNPDQLDLEIPETLLQEDPEKAVVRLNLYRDLGVRLTIDDFGAAGAVLFGLSRYPVQSIKLASQCIRGVTSDSAQAAMIASVVSLAHSLNICVNAKAVETQTERVCLEALGCDSYQGNFFTPALPKNLLSEFLKRQKMKAVKASVEKTQPMTHKDDTPVFVEPQKQGPSYVINCFSCHQGFNALEAQWCVCLTSDSSVVCPSCQRCSCRAPLDYRHSVWSSAPESFWDSRRKHEEDAGAFPLNASLDEIKRPLVLVVDDEALVLKTAYKLIRGMGYSVIVGRDGQQGLQLAFHYVPDLIISDALMPKMDGRELCALLKREPATSKMKMVIMTAFTGAAKYKANVIREFQFDEHLQKPVEFEKLRAVLQKLLVQ